VCASRSAVRCANCAPTRLMAKFFKVSVPLNRSFMLDPRGRFLGVLPRSAPMLTFRHPCAPFRRTIPRLFPKVIVRHPHRAQPDHIDHYFSRRRPQPRQPGSQGSFEALLIHAGNHLRRSQPDPSGSAALAHRRLIAHAWTARPPVTTLPGHRAQCRELRRRPGPVDGPHSGRRAAWLAVIPTRQVPVRAARRPASARCGAGDQLARPIEGVFTWQSPRLLRPVR